MCLLNCVQFSSEFKQIWFLRASVVTQEAVLPQLPWKSNLITDYLYTAVYCYHVVISEVVKTT